MFATTTLSFGSALTRYMKRIAAGTLASGEEVVKTQNGKEKTITAIQS